MIYDDYLDYTTQYQAKYGERTLVLMEVGSFFEIYAIDNAEEKVGPDIQRVCDLLNLQLSRKNKNILENHRGNPLMAGFPSHILSKHTQTLLQHNYTVVLIRQVTSPPNPKREVTEILSPAMQMTPNTIEGNYFMVFHWDIYTDAFEKRYLSVGIAGIDVSTGATFVYETTSTPRDPANAHDEAVRCFQTFQPREIVLLGNKELLPNDIDTIESLLGARYDTSRSFHRGWQWNIDEYHSRTYQNALLQRAYPNTGMLSPLEAIHIEKYALARTAFVYMIQFAYEHDARMIQYLQLPQHLTHDHSCILEYNSAVQLNVVSSGQPGERPLLTILNRCATAFGARSFRERLLQPHADVKALEQQYDEIDSMIQNKTYEEVHRHLRKVVDIERITRRMLLGSFSPTDWPSLHHSFEALREVAHLLEDHSLLKNISEIQESYVAILDLEECAKYLFSEIKGTVFQTGYHTEVDALQQQWNHAWNQLQAFAKEIEHHGGESCKIESSDRDGYSITITKKRWDAVDKKALSISGISVKPISTSSSIVRLKHTWIDHTSDTILKTQTLLMEMVSRVYREFIKRFIETHRDTLESITRIMAHRDVIATHAKNATEFAYRRPRIIKDALHGEIDAKQLRHPILERLVQQTMYVPNDIQLKDQRGLLLFGMNASGKSSFMKAIGLNILMAQAGMFVAAHDFVFAPYRHIFTRITGQDNIYRGLSTFAVEMMELRNILQRCDRKSLVLGDELCAGTESISALAIVSAGIETLSQLQCTFVFATHLHDLSRMKRITEQPSVMMAHMHVEIETGTGRIIYDRQLRPGSGSALYGLEVCRGLGLPHSFLKIAHEVRCEIEGVSNQFQTKAVSRYNAGVYVQECHLCGAPAEEVHHIEPQKEADSHGNIGHYHKNRRFNLLPLCESCHDQIHHGEMEVVGYQATSEGPKLKTRLRKKVPLLDTPKESVKDSLWSVLRYRDGFFTRKTTRSRWTRISEKEAIVIAEKRHRLTEVSSLERELFDPSLPIKDQ